MLYNVTIPKCIDKKNTCNSYTVEPRLSKSPLSEPSVIRTLFRVLKSQRRFDFLQNQVINEMPV